MRSSPRWPTVCGFPFSPAISSISSPCSGLLSRSRTNGPLALLEERPGARSHQVRCSESGFSLSALFLSSFREQLADEIPLGSHVLEEAPHFLHLIAQTDSLRCVAMRFLIWLKLVGHSCTVPLASDIPLGSRYPLVSNPAGRNA